MQLLVNMPHKGKYEKHVGNENQYFDLGSPSQRTSKTYPRVYRRYGRQPAARNNRMGHAITDECYPDNSYGQRHFPSAPRKVGTVAILRQRIRSYGIRPPPHRDHLLRDGLPGYV